MAVVAAHGRDAVARGVEARADDGARAAGVAQPRKGGVPAALVHAPHHHARLDAHIPARGEASGLVHRQAPNVVGVPAEVALRPRLRFRGGRGRRKRLPAPALLPPRLRRRAPAAVVVVVLVVLHARLLVVHAKGLHDAHARGVEHRLLRRLSFERERALVHLFPALGRLGGDLGGEAEDGHRARLVHQARAAPVHVVELERDPGEGRAALDVRLCPPGGREHARAALGVHERVRGGRGEVFLAQRAATRGGRGRPRRGRGGGVRRAANRVGAAGAGSGARKAEHGLDPGEVGQERGGGVRGGRGGRVVVGLAGMSPGAGSGAASILPGGGVLVLLAARVAAGVLLLRLRAHDVLARLENRERVGEGDLEPELRRRVAELLGAHAPVPILRRRRERAREHLRGLLVAASSRARGGAESAAHVRRRLLPPKRERRIRRRGRLRRRHPARRRARGRSEEPAGKYNGYRHD